MNRRRRKLLDYIERNRRPPELQPLVREATSQPSGAAADTSAPEYRAGYLAALEAVHDRYEFGPERTIQAFDTWLHERIMEARNALPKSTVR